MRLVFNTLCFLKSHSGGSHQKGAVVVSEVGCSPLVSWIRYNTLFLIWHCSATQIGTLGRFLRKNRNSWVARASRTDSLFVSLSHVMFVLPYSRPPSAPEPVTSSEQLVQGSFINHGLFMLIFGSPSSQCLDLMKGVWCRCQGR